MLVQIFVYQPWSPYNSSSKSTNTNNNNNNNNNLLWSNWFQILMCFSVLKKKEGKNPPPPPPQQQKPQTRKPNPENFKDNCKNSDSDTASNPRSALRVIAAAQRKLCKVLPAVVAVLCLAECKEQAENYRQGEAPGWYYTNPCWDNNLRWRLAESPKFNFGRDRICKQYSRVGKNLPYNSLPEGECQIKGELKRCPFIFFFSLNQPWKLHDSIKHVLLCWGDSLQFPLGESFFSSRHPFCLTLVFWFRLVFLFCLNSWRPTHIAPYSFHITHKWFCS